MAKQRLNYDQEGGQTISWTPTIGGFSAVPTAGVYQYTQVGKMVTLLIDQPNLGTSNSTSFTLTLPVAARSNVTGMDWAGIAGVIDNSVASAWPALLQIAATSPTVVNVYKDFQGTSFTASGLKRIVRGVITYEAA